jgi:hypothetical protein
MSLNEQFHKQHVRQRKEKEWDTLADVWKQRLEGHLMDIADPSEFKSATTAKDGTKKFFLCDSKKVDVNTIRDGKFKLVKKHVVEESVTTHSSLSKTMGTSTVLPKLSILKNHPPTELLKLSFVRPTLTGNSIGPGDAHERSLANYYHVQDSLAPDPLGPGEVPGSMINFYENSAPPMRPPENPAERDRGLLCGATGKEIPYPHVVDYRTETERVNFEAYGMKALNKNTTEQPRRVLQYGKAKPSASNILFDHLDEIGSLPSSASVSLAGDSIASDMTRGTKGSKNSKNSKVQKSMTSAEVAASLEEMSNLLDDISVTGSTEGGKKGWQHAGLAISKHFNLIRRAGTENKYLYKDDSPTRFYKRFLEEGPRRGDGCFDSDPVADGALQIQGLLHSTKEYEGVRRHKITASVPKMKQTLSQQRILKDLEEELKKAQRRLESSKIWQDAHGKRPDKKKDKRDLMSIFESSSEEEEEEIVEEKPKTREELWAIDTDIDLFATKEVKEKKKEKEEYSEREVFNAGMELMEDVLQEYVCEFIMDELERLEDLGMQACVVEVQARFRGWRWRNANFKVVNRLQMRAKSRQKRRRSRTGEEAAAEAAAAAAAADQEFAAEWGPEWKTLQDEQGAWYYYNEITGETQWA